MVISGLAKLTLLDYPGKTACTVFTGGCNFRCPFCHNALLVTGELAAGQADEEANVLAHLAKRRGVLDGVCITGGEPLLNKDIGRFIEEIRALGYPVKLDTNGSFPDRLEELVRGGLVDYVAMDIKNSPEKYALTTGLPDIDVSRVSRSVEFLKEGKVEYEFRTTVVRQFHEAGDFKRIGEWIAGAKNYFLQAFSDKGELISDGLSGYSKAEMEEFAEICRPCVANVQIRGI